MLLNISSNKGNQTVKFGQVIEHNKIFLQKNSYRKRCRETSSRTLFVFQKNFI